VKGLRYNIEYDIYNAPNLQHEHSKDMLIHFKNYNGIH